MISSDRKRLLVLLFPAMFLCFFIAGPLRAETVFTLIRSISPDGPYIPGTTIEVTVQLDLSSDGTPIALGLEETLPPGWSYQGQVSGPMLIIQPAVGKEGLLEFAWLVVPPFPLTFVYRVGIPSDATGPQLIQGQGLLRILTVEDEVRTPETVTILLEPEEVFLHSADSNGDNRIDLSELLRTIQFYNSGGYSCAPPGTLSEDGYVPGNSGLRDCFPHTGDYNPQDWIINLSELLRVIQFYNIGGYHECLEQTTEDGFCPGFG
jgi:hypothetical protein